jgi:N-acetylglutamate synthase-like GNAT family acetyltransferase
VIVEAKQLGVVRFYLITPDRASFYARLGWKKLETTEYRGETVTIMAYEFCGK